MIPESKFIESEVLIRKSRLPNDVLLTRKSTIRWLALSLGLINPNETRTVLIDLLDALFDLHYADSQPSTKDILAKMKEKTGEQQNPKAIYYHLQRLMDGGILNRKKGTYFFGDGDEKNLSVIFRSLYETRMNSAFSDIEKAFSRISEG